MPFVEIIRPCVAQGRRAKPGERLELNDSEARLLLGLRRAEVVDAPLPVVIEEVETSSPKASAKRSRRKPKPEGADAPSAVLPTVAVEEPSSDAPAAAD
jgi:hypothetical protein